MRFLKLEIIPKTRDRLAISTAKWRSYAFECRAYQRERFFLHRSQFSCPVSHVQPTAAVTVVPLPQLSIYFCTRFQSMLVNRTCYNSEWKSWMCRAGWTIQSRTMRQSANAENDKWGDTRNTRGHMCCSVRCTHKNASPIILTIVDLRARTSLFACTGMQKCLTNV